MLPLPVPVGSRVDNDDRPAGDFDVERMLAAVGHIDAARAAFLAGAYRAAGAGPGPAAADALPTFCVLVGADTLRAEPALAELFGTASTDGAAAIGGQLRGGLGWTVWDDPEAPLARLTVRLVAPVRLAVALVVDCLTCRTSLWIAARGGTVALVDAARLDGTADGVPVDLLDRSLLLTAPRSSALWSVLGERGWPRPTVT